MSIVGALACLAVVGTVVAVVVAVVVTRRKRRQRSRTNGRPAPADPFRDRDSEALHGNPRALKAGDILDTQGQSLAVRGTLRMREGGYQWAEHLLDTTDGRKQWLSVAEDPDLMLVLWHEVDSGEAPAPGARSVQWHGVTYRLVESGQAQYTSEAATGLAPTGTVRYYDYRADEVTLLSYEDFRGNGAFEVATGQQLDHREIHIYPGSLD